MDSPILGPSTWTNGLTAPLLNHVKNWLISKLASIQDKKKASIKNSSDTANHGHITKTNHIVLNPFHQPWY